jgi:hypothetical protein
LSEEDIIARADCLGVSLGKNKQEILNSDKSIKDIKTQRTLVI